MQLIKFMRSLTPNPRYLHRLLLIFLVFSGMPMTSVMGASGKEDQPFEGIIGPYDYLWKVKKDVNGKIVVDKDKSEKILDLLEKGAGGKYKRLIDALKYNDDDQRIRLDPIYELKNGSYVYNSKKTKTEVIEPVLNAYGIQKDTIDKISTFYDKKYKDVDRKKDGTFDAQIFKDLGLDARIISDAEKENVHIAVRIANIIARSQIDIPLEVLLEQGAGIFKGIGHLFLGFLSDKKTQKAIEKTLFSTTFGTHFTKVKSSHPNPQVAHVWIDVVKQIWFE